MYAPSTSHPRTLHIGWEALEEITFLRLFGDLDEAGISKLGTALTQCLRDGHQLVVIDVSSVGFVSYMTVGLLEERLRQHWAHKGDIRLTGSKLYLERMLRKAGLTSLLQRSAEERAVSGRSEQKEVEVA